MPDPIIILGATTGWGTTSTSFTAIPRCTAVVLPVTETEYVETTDLDSPGNFREYKPGLRDGGTVTLPMRYTPDTMELAKSYSDDGTLIWFESELTKASDQTTVGDVYLYSGHISPQPQDGQQGAALDMNLEIRVSGQFWFTKGS
ncbi:hypothetical protein [Tropicimonas marinistellae]|uniref:hypothetical protein n=1 Tax=Tropicimonas marinistellae TaxID=1739787 RepID=UPI000834A3B0|nr:hypothetical protein [Tropicimonas marinistellae]